MFHYILETSLNLPHSVLSNNLKSSFSLLINFPIRLFTTSVQLVQSGSSIQFSTNSDICNPQMQNICNPHMQNICNPQMQNICNPQMQNIASTQSARSTERINQSIFSHVTRFVFDKSIETNQFPAKIQGCF